MQFNNIASIIFALAAADVGLASPAARLAPNLQARSCDCSCNADCATNCANGFGSNPVGQGLCVLTCAPAKAAAVVRRSFNAAKHGDPMVMELGGYVMLLEGFRCVG
ncbi:hypothetical protein SCAR479_13313 [Seiridium cardinale]|uniref:Uncharacterized protein n=1 Tax=Seiridium cardinale TaxID=138064 RepID=A0ABR2X869_9PEZI